MDFDTIITEVGGKGKYQMVRYILLAALPVAMSWHLVGNLLLTASPKHTCVPRGWDGVADNGHLTADYQCVSEAEKLFAKYNKTGETYNSLLKFTEEVILEEHKNKPSFKKRMEQIRRLFVRWNPDFKPVEQECQEINYQKKTGKFALVRESQNLCNIIVDVAENGIPDDIMHKNTTDKETGEHIQVQRSSSDILSFLDKKLNAGLCEGKTCFEDSVPCQNFTFDLTHYTETAVTEFQLVCEDYTKVQLLQVAVMIGVFIGAVAFGRMSDTMGRKPCITAALLTSFGGMVAASMAPNYWTLFICRAINGAGAIGAISSAFVLTSEIFDPNTRVMALQVAQALFGVGQALLALIGYYVRNWRHVAAIISIPTAMGFLTPCFLDESARWLISRKRIEQAENVLQKIAKVNGKTFKGLAAHGVTKDDSGEDTPTDSPGFNDFFRHPRLRYRTLNLFYQWFMLSGVYYGLTMNATSLAGDPFLNLAISGLIEVPAELLAGVLFMKIGRRWSMIIFNFFGGFACLMMMFVNEGSTASIVLPLCGKFALTGGYGGIYVYTAELFPTTLRNAGIGLCSSVARLGGITAPLIGILAMFGAAIPYVIFGCLGLTGAVLTMFLPEVLDRTLPDTVEEGEVFGLGEPTAMEDLMVLIGSLFRVADDTTPTAGILRE